MMKSSIIFCCLLSVLSISVTTVHAEEAQAAAVAAAKGGYETKYDNIDLDEVLKNDRLRKNYIKCLINNGPCTPDAQELKSNWKSHNNINPFKQINQTLKSLKDFLVRLTSRRNSYQLLKMYRKTKSWLRKSDTLSH